MHFRIVAGMPRGQARPRTHLTLPPALQPLRYSCRGCKSTHGKLDAADSSRCVSY